MRINFKKLTPYFIIAVASVIALSVFFGAGYPSGHDLDYHAASVIGMSSHSFWDIFTSKIFGFVSNDLGFGEGLFYPPFAHICAAVIYKLGGGLFSVFTVFKIFYLLTMFFSGVFFRKFILLVTKNEKAALMSAVFYVTAPYFIVDIVVRSAMTESTLFLFMPIVLIGIYHLLKDNYRSFLIYFTIGCVGLIHSHLVLTMYFILLCFIGFLPKIKDFFQKKRLLYICISVVITGLISLPFLIPMLQNKMNANYHVFEPNFMVTLDSIESFRVPFDYLFSLDQVIGNVPLYLNFFGIIAVIYAIINYRKIKNKDNQIFLFAAIITTVICIFCSTTMFSWKHIPGIFLFIQFSWRLLSFAALGMAIIVGISLPKMETDFSKSAYLILALACLIGIAQVNSYQSSVNTFDQTNLYTSAMWSFDYVPIEIKDREIVKTHDHKILADDAKISDVESNTPDLSFKITQTDNKNIQVTIPRYYYLGYRIKATFLDGQTKVLDYYNHDGFVTFNLDQDAEISIDYPGTVEQRVSYWVAGATITGFVAYIVISSRKKKTNPKA